MMNFPLCIVTKILIQVIKKNPVKVNQIENNLLINCKQRNMSILEYP